MKKSILLLSVLTILFSCNKNEKLEKKKSNTKNVTVNESDFTVDVIPENCYFLVKGNDTTFVTIEDNLGTITGKIEYSKDNVADLIGFTSEDTLKLEARFPVIIDSVIVKDSVKTKDLWFVREYGNLYEGTGKRNDDGTYLHPSFLKYDDGMIYKPIDCNKK